MAGVQVDGAFAWSSGLGGIHLMSSHHDEACDLCVDIGN
jgi:hypothetical protein